MKKILTALVLFLSMCIANMGYAAEYHLEIGGQGSGRTVLQLNAAPGDTITLTVYAAAGTGHSWHYTMEQGAKLLLTSQATVPAYQDNRVGGPLQTKYVFTVAQEACGSETVKVFLARSWENKAPVREIILKAKLSDSK